MKQAGHIIRWGVLALLLSGCGNRDRVPRGELFVMSEPSGAVVEVNGEMLGTTPLQDSRVPSGRLLVSIRMEGYETEWRTVNLATDSRQVLEVKLRPQSGLVVINSLPQGATVHLGNVQVGTTPVTLYDLERGSYNARLELEGHDSNEISFTVRDRVPRALNVDLVSNSGRLLVESEPPGARVFVDGRSEGETPLSLDRVPRGRREVELRLTGFQTYRRSLTVEAGDTSRVDAELDPIPGRLRVTTSPSGSRVFVNDRMRGEAPLEVEGLAPGQYTLRVEQRGHESASRLINIEAGEELVESFELERNSGTLQLVTRPAGVSVSIDGEFIGVTEPARDGSDVVSRPMVIDMLSQGSHTLQLVREGYAFETKRFFITRDEVTALDETLERQFIPNVLVRTGPGRDEVITAVLERRHPNGDLDLEIRRGVFRTMPAGSYLSVEPLREEEDIEDLE